MDALWAVGFALSALYAVIGLAVACHHAVERYQVLAALPAVLGRACIHRQRAFVLTFIIMYEDGGNVYTIGTGHTVFAVVAGNILETYYFLCHFLVEIAHFFVGQWL